VLNEIKPALTTKQVIILIVPTNTRWRENSDVRILSSMVRAFPSIQVYAEAGRFCSESTCINSNPQRIRSALKLTVIVEASDHYVDNRPPILDRLANWCQQVCGGTVTAIWNGNVYTAQPGF
jgi:hypothetical protein